MNPTERLAAFIAETSFGSVPREVYEKSKWPIIDYLAVTISDYLDAGHNIVSFVKDLGGDPVSTILGAGYRTNAPLAAYANGTMSHVLDYDDMNENIGGHPTGPVLSALLAVGEMLEATGEEILLRISASKDSTISEWGGRVRIETVNGKTISHENTQFPGITSWNDLKTKFHDCTVPVLGSERSEQVINMVQQFEKISNISDLVQILVRV